jgi:hypothetical protein
MITQSAARGEIFTQFKTGWDSNSAAVAGYIPEVEWQGVQLRETPDIGKYWVRVSIQTVGENQSSLSVAEGINGQRRYTAFGFVIIQVFAPRSTKDSFQNGIKLAEIAKKIFRGKTTPGKIWFRNVRVNELSPENSFYRLNVVAEFEYDELG